MRAPDESFGLHKQFSCGQPIRNAGETLYPVMVKDFVFGIAVAYIDQSQRHLHERTWETYVIMNGNLIVEVNGVQLPLGPHETIRVPAFSVHHLRKLNEQTVCALVITVPSFDSCDFVLSTNQEPLEIQYEPFE